MEFLSERTPGVLVLADGTVFPGVSIGADGAVVGEVVFNTAMTGYQEILTDPSYAKQIVTLTYPHIGNVGLNAEDMESDSVWASGLIIRELSHVVSNWRSEISLPDFLQKHNTIALAEIDTRSLTRLLREKGAQNGCIMTGDIDVDKALKLAREFAGLEGMNLADDVTRKDTVQWDQNTAWVGADKQTESAAGQGKKVVVYDFGVKSNILKLLADTGAQVKVVPAQTSAEDVIALSPDMVLLSNGPGDPAVCDQAIANTRELLQKNIPVMGICLGCQLLALACGAKTMKMKFGHHGANHPVQDLETSVVGITSQNHGFAIDETTLPANLEVTHRSLFDGTIQGIRHKEKPAFAFQGHPEASPGPHDIAVLINQFVSDYA